MCRIENVQDGECAGWRRSRIEKVEDVGWRRFKENEKSQYLKFYSQRRAPLAFIKIHNWEFKSWKMSGINWI